MVLGAPTRTRIYGWAADNDGCGYYRIKLPLSTLDPTRYHVTYSTVLPLTWPYDADVIIGQRVCLPAPSRMWREVCADRNVLAVYEIDDNLLDMHHTNTAAGLYGLHGVAGQEVIRDNIRANAAAADRVTVTTEPLAEIMREFNPNVVVVDNYVAGTALDLTRRDPDPDGNVSIGYSGTRTHAIDFAVAQPHLKRLMARNPRVWMRFVGAGYPGLDPGRTVDEGWVKGTPRYLESVARAFDIGIAPLRPHPFIRSKSRIKFLEYAAIGLPAVVSDEAPYRDHVQHGVTGFLVRRDHEWLAHLAALVEDPELRAAVGAAAKVWAAGETIEANIGLWEKALST